jgi:hypothetical protein
MAIHLDKHKEGRNRLWQNIQSELQKLIDDFDIPVSALATGLGVSRQKLNTFLKEPTDGISINRYSIIGLFDYLTDEKEITSKRIAQRKKDKRQELKEKGPNSMLVACGFQPNTDFSELGEINPQAKRILSRLSSSWIIDDELRSDITDDILDQILDRGRVRKNMRVISGKEAEDWPIECLSISSGEEAIESYVKQVRLLTKTGKTEFAESELFELYQSIYEHRLLRYPSSNTSLSVRDCQFDILSVRIIYDSKDEEFLEHFRNLRIKADRKLTNLLGFSQEETTEGRNIDNLEFSHIIQAIIECDLVLKNGQSKKITFRNSSTATHTENMLSALQKGLCYSLGIRGFYVRVAGSTEKSLARTTINLAEYNEKTDESQETCPTKVYHGWWVGPNIVLGVSKATVEALKSWINSVRISSDDYFSISAQISEIERDLFDSRDSLYENSPAHSKVRLDSLEREIKETTEEIKNLIISGELKEQYFNNHLDKLKKQSYLIDLMRLHESLVRSHEGCLTKQSKVIGQIHYQIKEIEYKLAKEESEYKNVLLLHLTACMMLFNFIKGEREFLLYKPWRTSQNYSLEQLIPQLSQYVKSIHSIDFDTYLYTSKLYGVVGFLEFYSAVHESDFQEAYEKSVMAAHYSSRVGHVKWSAYWFGYASRALAAISDFKKAKHYVALAEEVANKGKGRFGVNTDKSPQNLLWPMANINLAKGEIELIKKENLRQAIREFCLGLKNSVYFKFYRLFADCYYNLVRTVLSAPVKNRDSVSQLVVETLQATVNLLNRIDEDHVDNSELFLCLTNTLDEIKNMEDHKKITDYLMLEAKKIWNAATDNGHVHPVAASLGSRELFVVKAK